MEGTTGTKTDLAQALGVSVKRVTSAIERGEIKPERIGRNDQGHRYVADMEGAIADFRAAKARAAGAIELPKLPEGIDPRQLGNEDDMLPPEGVDLKVAQTVHQWWSAMRQRMRYEREAGKLVACEKVRRDVFAITRAARDAILAVPDRVGDDLAAESDAARVRERLRDELTRTLTVLADSMEKVCA